MMRKVFLAGLALASLPAFAAGPEWRYVGPEGPDHWAELGPEYSACNGKSQSPIDIDGYFNAHLQKIGFNYEPGTLQIVDNGHTVQVNYAPGSNIELEGVRYYLKQFHFHSPSENHIHGKSYPMEMHLVHADVNGNLAVVAVMFEEGKANETLAELWQRMPNLPGEPHDLDVKLSAESLLPHKRDYYRFSGSLTTPPCTEGVRWVVMRHPVEASKAQITQFSNVMGEPNNRPVQALNARPILE